MKLAFVGEAWGEEEEQVGKPFVGRSGQQLDKLLRASRIERSECYVTNVVHARPAENDFGVFYEDKARRQPTEELLKCHERLKGELLEQGFGDGEGVVVALGNEPLYALTGKRGIESWRGSVLKGVGGIKVVPTFHPSALLRIGKENVWYVPAALHDLDRAVREVGQGFPQMPQIYVATTAADLRVFLEEARGKKVAVDIETSFRYLGEQVSSIAFSSQEGKALVVPFISEVEEEMEGEGKKKPKKKWRSYPTMPGDEFIEVQKLIGMFFASPDWLKVGQNIQYDVNVLTRLGWIRDFDGLYMDTLAAHANLIEPEFPHDLGFLCSWYTRYPYYKFMVSEVNEALWTYNGWDAAATLEVCNRMDEDMDRRGVSGFYHGYINRLIPAIASMNRRGLLLDMDYRESLKERLETEIVEARRELDDLTDHGIDNHRSPKQVGEYFYVKKGYKGGPSTDEVALKKIRDTYHDLAANALLKLRELEKLLGTYVLMDTDEGVVRTSYSFAKTGRFRSGGGE